MADALTLGSLFDGSGGFPLAGLLCGICPVWASEIEPFPIRVTTKRLPMMRHYGDIGAISGADIEPVDIICFGSPCTDLSVAGKRAGLDGEQSGLFFEAIRIIKEMREKTHGSKPNYLVWENVPGAFSSNQGRDFKAVLDEILSVVEDHAEVPLPETGRWPHADCLLGDGWSLAYRTLDAQFWGVPQRRRRIFLVADLGGRRAPEVLFEYASLSGNPAQSRSARESTATGPGTGAEEAGKLVLNDQGGSYMAVSSDQTFTLRATANHPPCILENHATDSRIKIDAKQIVQTLTSRMGTGGMNVPLLLDNDPNSPAMPYGIGNGQVDQTRLQEKIGALSCMHDQQAVLVPETDDSASVPPGPIYAMTSGKFAHLAEDICPTLLSRDYKDPTVIGEPVFGIDRSAYNQGRNARYKPIIEEELSPTLVAQGPCATYSEYVVRRLTPTECARLQGFPSDWCRDLGTDAPDEPELAFWEEVFETHRSVTGRSTRPKTRSQILKWLRDPHSDAAEYKMWGNGVALPCVRFVLDGIARVHCPGEETIP